jgi:hypothetical protein
MCAKDELGSPIPESTAATRLSNLVVQSITCILKEKVDTAGIARILAENAHRRSRMSKELTVLLECEEAKELFGKEDVDTVDKAKAEQEKCEAAVADLEARVRLMRAGGETPHLKRGPVKYASNHSFTEEEADGLMPLGYRVWRDRFNGCWRVANSKTRFTVSKSWGETGDDYPCIISIARSSWDHFCSMNPGELCPWDF